MGRLARYVLPLLLLAFFAWEKAQLNPIARNEPKSDGSYYLQIAENVAEGAGLRTSVSLQNQGLRAMPGPATIQPLWPLILGYTGRLMDMDRAARVAPELLYFVSLILLYLLANRISRALGTRALLRVRGVTVLDLGTLAMACLGANPVFIAYTSKPYTEGLAFSLLFASLLALPTPGSRRILARAAAGGALAGLVYLTRSQLVLVPVALAAAIGLVGIREMRLRTGALVSLAASLLVTAPWFAYLASLPGLTPLSVLVRFTAYRESASLPQVPLTVDREGATAYVLDFLESWIAAFHPIADTSYVYSFGPIVYAIPVALGVAGWMLWQRWRRDGAPRTPGQKMLLPCATLFVAGAAVAPLHVAHMSQGWEWLFAWRHGLPVILAIVLAMGFLWRLGTTARVALLLAMVATMPLREEPSRWAKTGPRLLDTERALAVWIDEHPRPPVVMTFWARRLVLSSQAVAHSMVCGDSETFEQFFAEVPVDYVVVYKKDVRDCPALVETGRDAMEPVVMFGRRDGVWIKVWRPAGRAPMEGVPSRNRR